MDFEKMTEKVRGFFQAAQTLATRKNHQSLEPEHLLRVMMDDDTGLVDTLLRGGGASPEKLKFALDRALAKFPQVTGGGAGLRLSTDLNKIADSAQVLAEKSGDKFITTERLLQAMLLARTAPVAELLMEAGLDDKALNTAVNDRRKGRTADSAGAEDQFD
ncbi:MAG: ATP-dependent chaperone ClpB, partial [Alphaproteobacteria bacterium]|nr:ATP-dependent chaperone ClpB [Alphaproteobacteria bacterium]